MGYRICGRQASASEVQIINSHVALRVPSRSVWGSAIQLPFTNAFSALPTSVQDHPGLFDETYAFVPGSVYMLLEHSSKS